MSDQRAGVEIVGIDLELLRVVVAASGQRQLVETARAQSRRRFAVEDRNFGIALAEVGVAAAIVPTGDVEGVEDMGVGGLGMWLAMPTGRVSSYCGTKSLMNLTRSGERPSLSSGRLPISLPMDQTTTDG